MATDKQIAYAAKLGIENPSQYDTKALSALIDAKLGKVSPTPRKPSQNGSNSFTAVSQVVINRTDKPHSFEFGKAGMRHKIYYNDVLDLQLQIAELEKIGLIDLKVVEGKIIPTVTPEEFE